MDRISQNSFITVAARKLPNPYKFAVGSAIAILTVIEAGEGSKDEAPDFVVVKRVVFQNTQTNHRRTWLVRAIVDGMGEETRRS